MTTTPSGSADRSPSPFADLDAYTGLPRLGGLWLSPDGRRLVVGVATPDHARNRYTTALWEVDPEGSRAARRLTRGTEGESGAAFTPAGDLLFVSARPEPGAEPGAESGAAGAALWSLPAGGGDARVAARPPGGVRGVVVSPAGTVVLGSALMPSAADAAEDKEIRARRKDAGVSAILHEEYPVRHWGHDLGPDRTRLLVGEVAGDLASDDGRLDLRDITGHVGQALDDECGWDIAPDGRTVVTMWAVPEPGGSQRYTVVAVDVATGERRTLADDADHEYESPRFSPDGTRVALTVHRRPTPRDPGDSWLGVVPLSGGEVRPLTAAWDRLPHSAHWTPDGAALLVTADDHGRCPLWRVDVVTGEVTRLTWDDGAYTDIRVAPDGRWAYALRAAVDSPPAPVRVALDDAPRVEPLPGPAEALGRTVRMPGRLTEVTTTAADGAPLRAWLALPEDAGAKAPAPLLLWIHGGPVNSWNTWSWRWNPWIAVAHGYAVLLPDPALSTGYGVGFVQRGWGAWGGAPYTDLMAITDAAQERADIDADRTAAMGGSFGGYMANWMAGHTDRFAAIVTHASIWALDQAMSTTDAAYYWFREMTPEVVGANSPHHFAAEITTPMLVVHGDRDHRVPIGEALRLWWDLSSLSKAEDGATPHKFLYFPEENHWVLAPNHAKVWYATVLAFLARHVRGEDWRRPDLLG
ncbi:S9 family peptidase [Streptomyces litchfieldiae]|uniref:Prolyl oligopeptidase family serine peptidase n=1 Tax=Streptomyces litchfieldiae TaxID=3075543 RepID=A0ABU2N0N9_9ACTN|nr:alpha/beta fold hydrolase [Streptomyces sp. DSM 44938]MDT0346643.1 prolyl oligopeptidase family serine peptidase [Streptomyces sp. DSM 44938]